MPSILPIDFSGVCSEGNTTTNKGGAKITLRLNLTLFFFFSNSDGLVSPSSTFKEYFFDFTHSELCQIHLRQESGIDKSLE